MNTSRGRTISSRLVASISLCSMLVAIASFTNQIPVTSASPRPFGDVEVLATVPSPGFPEGIAAKGKKVYVAGPAHFGTTGSGPSEVWAFDISTGALLRTYVTQGEDLLQEHANSCVAFDGNGRLYVNNIQLGVFRINLKTGEQEAYSAPFPNLPPCVPVLQGAPCSPTLADTPALPNDIVFDDAGNAYVTDSLQATIWRIPPGGGQPQIWFQDSRFASPYVGVNGLRLDPSHTKLYITVTTDLMGQGYIYTLPLVEQPTAADLAVFYHYSIGESPDGIAFGQSGLLYVALALPMGSGISILRPDGTEAARLTNPLLSPIFPYDSPANIAFNHHGSLLVTNHAFATMLPSHFTVLDVFVDDQESTLAKPMLP